MANEENTGLTGLAADKQNLYREEVFSDLKAATIRRLTPVNEDGEADSDRKTLYTAQTHVMTPNGALPISADIEAVSLGDAFDKFPDAIEQEVQRLRDEVQKQQIANAGKGFDPGALSGQRQGGGDGNIIV